MRYLVTNPKPEMQGADIYTKFSTEEDVLDIRVGETKEVSAAAAKWLAYTYDFLQVSELPDAPKEESKTQVEEEREKPKSSKEELKKKLKKSK